MNLLHNSWKFNNYYKREIKCEPSTRIAHDIILFFPICLFVLFFFILLVLFFIYYPRGLGGRSEEVVLYLSFLEKKSDRIACFHDQNIIL